MSTRKKRDASMQGTTMKASTTYLFAAVLATASLISATVPAMARNNAPLGYQLMCLQTPSECKGGGAAAVTATSDVMGKLIRVNSHVNSTIRPRNDSGADVWSVNVSVGDCEDYALTKRRALINAGIPASSLRIAYVKTRSGEGHAILVVKTKNGDYVLDNLNASVRPLSQTGYRILSEAGANPMNWS
jgi:predicted transglutaminase-like cysteine proteinase